MSNMKTRQSYECEATVLPSEALCVFVCGLCSSYLMVLASRRWIKATIMLWEQQYYIHRVTHE